MSLVRPFDDRHLSGVGAPTLLDLSALWAPLRRALGVLIYLFIGAALGIIIWFVLVRLRDPQRPGDSTPGGE